MDLRPPQSIGWHQVRELFAAEKTFLGSLHQSLDSNALRDKLKDAEHREKQNADTIKELEAESRDLFAKIDTLAGKGQIQLPTREEAPNTLELLRWVDSLDQGILSEQAVIQTRFRQSSEAYQSIFGELTAFPAENPPSGAGLISEVKTEVDAKNNLRIEWKCAPGTSGMVTLKTHEGRIISQEPTIKDGVKSASFNGLTAGQTCEYEISEQLRDEKPALRIGTVSIPPPPSFTISNIRVTEITSTTAKIEWTSSAPSQTIVRYGVNRNCGASNKNSNEFGKEHSTRIEGLEPGTEYFFFIPTGSRNFSPDEVERTFKTLAEPVPAGPSSPTFPLTMTPPMTTQAASQADELLEMMRSIPASLPPSSDILPKSNFTNSIGMEMIWVPANSLNEETGITGDGFFVSKFEVTRMQYSKIRDYSIEIVKRENLESRLILPEDTSPAKDSLDLPVQNVQWPTAVAFTYMLNVHERSSGQPKSYLYSLPLIREWRVYSRGASVAKAVTGFNSYQNPLPVGKAGDFSPLGLSDLLGNVSEWAYDLYEPELNGPDFNPSVPSLFDEKEGSRAFTGGNYLISYRESDLLNPARVGGAITQQVGDTKVGQSGMGFRVVLRAVLKPQSSQ